MQNNWDTLRYEGHFSHFNNYNPFILLLLMLSEFRNYIQIDKQQLN